MRKIIDGKRYDTETATDIASSRYSLESDAHFYEETLYKTKKSAYFLYGRGGAMSKYGEQIGTNTFSGSSVIRPLGPEEAYDWLENTGQTEAIESEFPDMIENA